MGISYITGVSTENLPFSDAVIAGDFIFVSGMCGFGANGEIVAGGVGEETRQIFHDLAALLARAGATLDQVVKVNVHLVDRSDFDEFNRAYSYFFPGYKPARITVCSGMTIDARIEMDFTVYIGN